MLFLSRYFNNLCRENSQNYVGNFQNYGGNTQNYRGNSQNENISKSYIRSQDNKKVFILIIVFLECLLILKKLIIRLSMKIGKIKTRAW